MSSHPLVDRTSCSITRSLDVLGDTWSVLVIREMFLGPVVLEHGARGHVAQLVPTCSACGGSISAREMRARPRASGPDWAPSSIFHTRRG